MIMRWSMALLLLMSLIGSMAFGQPINTVRTDATTSLVPELPVNGLFSMVLLDQDSNNIKDDIHLTIILPNNDTLRAVTRRGFVSIDLVGMARPEEVLLVKVPYQIHGDLPCRTYFQRTFLFILGESRNVTETVVCEDPAKRPICELYNLNPTQIQEPRIPRETEHAMPPLFGAKSPEEKAAAKAARKGNDTPIK